jgi:diguanylate cyclase (GGDEF)-like protein
MIESTSRWWQQADHFDWFSAYLQERGLQTLWRALTFGFTASLAVVPVLLLGSPTGPDNTVTSTVSIVAALCGAVSGLLWLTRWPTRRQSALFAVLATSSIAATCFAQSDPYASLMGCTTFAIIGGFVAYFHTVRLVAFILAVSTACSAIGAYRLFASTGDLPLVCSALLIVLALNSGVPFGIHSLAHNLRRDLMSSGHDPLTGLLNRRAFYPAAYELLMRSHGSGTHLVVTVIDLDSFKNLNDTQGHAVGDQALASVGAALRDNCPNTAVIGRAGGEEFVIADSGSEANPAAMAERLRRAISAVPVPITASIGTASAPLNSASTNANLELIDSLIRTADAAMYDAKRAGGDRVCHRSQLVPSAAAQAIQGR